MYVFCQSLVYCIVQWYLGSMCIYQYVLSVSYNWELVLGTFLHLSSLPETEEIDKADGRRIAPKTVSVARYVPMTPTAWRYWEKNMKSQASAHPSTSATSRNTNSEC